MKTRWYAKLVMVVSVMALIAGLVVGCAGETTTVTQTKTATQTVTQTAGAGQTITVTATAPAATVTQTQTATVPGPTTTVTKTVGATPTAPQTFKLTVASGQPPTLGFVKILSDLFVPEVNRRLAERTNYKIEWSELYGGALVKSGEVLEGVQAGLADIGIPIPLFEPATLPVQAFTYNIPFGIADPYKLVYVTEKMIEEIPELTAQFEDFNQLYLGGFSLLSSYQVYTNVPITKLEDLKGLKISSGAANAPWSQAVGATPVTLTLPELYNLAQTGATDGVIVNRGAMWAVKAHEVLPYESLWNFGAQVPAWITINLNTWNKLPPEVQDILKDAAHLYTMAIAHWVLYEDVTFFDQMAKEGMVTTPIPLEERTKWVNILPNQPNEKAKEFEAKGYAYASDVFRAYFKYAKEIGAEMPRWYEID